MRMLYFLSAPSNFLRNHLFQGASLMKKQIIIPLVLFIFGSSAANADTFDPATGHITIDSIQVGGTVYTNVVIAFASVISVGGSTTITNYAKQYTGYYYYNGGGAGGWIMTISNTGAVTGTGTATCNNSCSSSGYYPLSGSLSVDGHITFTTYGGDSCSGTVDASTGAVSGTCNYAFNGSSGPFTGTKQTQPGG